MFFQDNAEYISDFDSTHSSDSTHNPRPSTPLDYMYQHSSTICSSLYPFLQSTPADVMATITSSSEQEENSTRTKTSEWLKGVSLDNASHVTETDMNDTTLVKTPFDSAKKVLLTFNR